VAIEKLASAGPLPSLWTNRPAWELGSEVLIKQILLVILIREVLVV
jgi:hypothetical protein